MEATLPILGFAQITANCELGYIPQCLHHTMGRAGSVVGVGGFGWVLAHSEFVIGVPQ